MSRAPEKFHYVFRYVYGLMGLVALAALAVIVSFYFVYAAERDTHARITSYHIESSTHAERLQHASQSLLRLLGYDVPTVSEIPHPDEHIIARGPDTRGTLKMMETTVAKIQDLFHVYGGEEYVATLGRIEERYRAVEYSIFRGDPTETSRRRILMFELAAEQLHRQHLAAVDSQRATEATLLARIAPYASFIAIIVMIAGTVTWIAMGLLHRSIARQVEVEDALTENLERMHHLEKLESLGRLVGGIAHDFNNFLTAILGQASLLLDRSSTDDRTREGLTQIREAGRQAASLTKQLLNFSRPQIVEVRVIDINEVIESTESMLARVIGEDVEMRIRLAKDVYPVQLDPGQLRQVIVNLVINSRDAMPDGGQLTIATRNIHVAESTAGFASVPSGRYAKITVSDTGIGMDEDTRERVFEPYFSTKEMSRGTGLGLSSAYGIITTADGHIDISSEPGTGTQVDILLPRSAQAATSLHDEAALAGDFAGNESILVVEDERQIREFLRQGLESLGYRVLLAADAAEGLEMCSETIDVVLSDVILPGMNGAELLLQVQKLCPDTVAILMSGYTDDVLERTGFDETQVPLIQKPFEIAHIAQLIREQLARRVKSQAVAAAS